jgi:hypothetical protein
MYEVERRLRRWVSAGDRRYRRATCRLRTLPDFVILGAQRAGTRTLDPEGNDPVDPSTTIEGFDDPRGDARRFSYLARGRYAEQLDRWFAAYPVEQLLVVETAGLSDGSAVRRVLDHIGLSVDRRIVVESRNVAPHPPAPIAVRQALTDYYAPHDSALRTLLGREMTWMSHSAG